MMSKVLKVMIIAVMILVATGALFAAKPEVLTIHLTATVPPRTSVRVADGGVDVSINSADVIFEAYDASGSLISTDGHFQAVDGARLSFSAV